MVYLDLCILSQDAYFVCLTLSRCCLFNNHQAKDYIDSFVTRCSRVFTFTAQNE